MTNAYATIADQGERHWATPLLQVKTDGRIDDTVTSPGESGARRERRQPGDVRAPGGRARGDRHRRGDLGGSRWPARRGRPTRTSTPGSAGTPCRSSTCVWMGYPQGEIPLENVEGVPSVYGGTIPAAIWHDFMTIAMEGQPPSRSRCRPSTATPIGPSVVGLVADALADPERDAERDAEPDAEADPHALADALADRRRPRRRARLPRRPALPDARAPGPRPAPRPRGSTRSRRCPDPASSAG